MANINPQFNALKREYIFPIIEKKLFELRAKWPEATILNFGVGDIALPLAPTVAHAICKATQEMAKEESLRGYGPSEGYAFLREAIAKAEYASLGIGPDEIFISDGANSDTANILEIFHPKAEIAIADPTYPVYLDSSILSGKRKRILLLPCVKETNFLPRPPQERCELVYLCSPNNPTGTAMHRQELQAWIDYARENEAVLLYDNAYAAFVRSPDVPKSIFEIEGAKEVAIEFKSFSKSAGFTGLRCAYTVLPKAVWGKNGKKRIPLHSLWMRRQSCKTNGVAYPIQRGAEAVFTPSGQQETRAQVESYLVTGQFLLRELKKLGFEVYGGEDSPYLWWKTPNAMPSWAFFDLLLEKCHLICIPGKGFGQHGEGFVRLSAFATADSAHTAIERIISVQSALRNECNR